MRYLFPTLLVSSLLLWWLWPSQPPQQIKPPMTTEPPLQQRDLGSSAVATISTGWRLSQPLQQGIHQLEAKAQQQDINAIYQLGRNLSWCFYSEDNDEAHQQKLDELRQNGDSSTSFASNYDRYEYCRGISRAQKNRFASLLMEAAQAGHPQAAAKIGKVSAKLYLQATGQDNLERDAYVKARQDYLTRRQQLLENSAHQSNVDALQLLVRDAVGQRIGSQSTAKALAYLTVLQHLDPDLTSQYQWQARRLEKTATAEDIELAEQISQSILN